MNRIYRLIWNTALHCWVVASELTQGRARRGMSAGAAVAAVVLASVMPAYAAQIDGDEEAVVLHPFALPQPVALSFARDAAARAGILGLHRQSALVTDSFYADSTITGDLSIILGSRGTMNGNNSAAYGVGVVVTGNAATAVGGWAAATATGATALGANAKASGTNAIAVGSSSQASGYDSTSIGMYAKATHQDATAVGSWSEAGGRASVAFGRWTKASGDYSTAVGPYSTAAGHKAVAAGHGSSAVGEYAIAIGDGASVVNTAADSVALGRNAAVEANARNAVALGAHSVADAANSVSVGSSSLKRRIVNVADGEISATSTDAVTGKQLHAAKINADAAWAKLTSAKTALGLNAAAGGTNATSVGMNTTAAGNYATAAGNGASAAGAYAVAAGSSSVASQASAVALGNAAAASAGNAVAVGRLARSQGTSAVALGNEAAASGNYTTAIGNQAKAGGAWTNAIGYQAEAGGSSSVALGSVSKALADHSIALGDRAQVNATANNSLALGRASSVADNATGAVALGYGSVAAAANTISVGSATLKRKIVNVADGVISSTSTEVVTGRQLHVTQERLDNASTHVGKQSSAGTNATAVGHQAAASGSHSTALGHASTSAGANAIAVGTLAAGAADASVAMGNRAAVDASSGSGIALGNNAKVNANAAGAVALGANSVATAGNTVSVGSGSLRRRIVNVADGALVAGSTDAATSGQLYTTNQQLGTVTTTANTAKSTADAARVDAASALGKANALGGLVGQVAPAGTVRLGAENSGTTLDVRNKANATRVITGVSDGSLGATSTDAVSGRQLNATNLLLGEQGRAVAANAQSISGNRTRIEGNQSGIGTNRSDIASNRTSIGANRDDIAALRIEFDDFAPDLEGVVTFNEDRTIVDMEGARVTGIREGDIGSADSRDAVTGGQLFSTNARIDHLEGQGKFVSVSFDGDSEQARTGLFGVAIGDSAEASLDSEGGTAIGSFSKARGKNSVALGRSAAVTNDAEDAFALGGRSAVSVAGGVALGAATVVSAGATHSVALGYGSIATEANTVSIGSTLMKRRLVNVGRGTKEDDATTLGQLKDTLSALGGGAGTDAGGAIINPTYHVQNGTQNTVGDALAALDGAVVAARDGVHSLDSRLNRLFQEESSARTDGAGRLTLGGTQGMVLGNVANGLIAAGSRDAVNGGQLHEVRKDLQGQIDSLADRGTERVAVSGRMGAAKAMSVDGTGGAAPSPEGSDAGVPDPEVKADGETAVAVGTEGKERSIRHVAKGSADTDAVNVRQLNEVLDRANEYTDLAVEGLNKRLDGMDKRFNRMAAMSSAQSAMAMNTAGLNTYNRLGAGVGHSDGESALAVGYQRVLNERGSATFSLNGAFTNSGEKTLGVGVGIGW